MILEWLATKHTLASKKVIHLEGATFKNKDLLSSSKLRELETLLTLPWIDLLIYLEQVNKRYTLLIENGMSLHSKEMFFHRACDDALALVFKDTDTKQWAKVYPNMTLALMEESCPKNWETTHTAFTALLEFMVRELSLSSSVFAWSATGPKEELP